MKTIAILGLLIAAAGCDASMAQQEPAPMPTAAAATAPSYLVGAWNPMLSGPSLSFAADGTFQWYTTGKYAVDATGATLTLTSATGAITYILRYPGFCGVDAHGSPLPAECLVLQDAIGNTGTYHKF